MIVTSEVVAQAGVETHLLEQDGALEEISAQLMQGVIREGENIGAFIRPGSVWISRRKDFAHRPGLEMVVCEWSPNPEQGCEFRGGPYDGDLKPLRREADGAPLAYYVLPDPTPVAFGPSDFEQVIGSPVDPSPARISYRRAGKDSDADRWVYVLD